MKAEEIQDAIESWSRRIFWSVLLLMAIAGYGWWTYLYQPAQAKNADLVAKVDKMTTRLSEMRKQYVMKGKNGIEESLGEYARQAQQIDNLIPSADFPSILRTDISQLAREHGVLITKIETLPSGSQGGFLTTGYSLGVTGLYNDVGRFITRLLSRNRTTQISNITLKAIPPEQKPGETTGSSLSTAAGIDGPWHVMGTFNIVEFSRPDAAHPLPGDAIKKDSTAGVDEKKK